ncbi:hypothetical protein BKE38_05480 [Pseudoroseomonas deserti]|uniref:Calx-beta domain-containing protein n=1 Tax=Teichococcus deserti TaxID=1817963 RepID=A0A1V2H674_9PROT|nr:ExeM/NucH family extracellular endonuclease [Pseudoroseomonas deserti]ONG56676.1 hypothetical protein BKE38_05480 [Pseudoroseomonas deserti]
MTATYFRLREGSFRQDWSDAGLITTNDDWSNVPSIQGFLGEELTAATGTDPRSITGSSPTLDVIADQANPNTLSSGGVAEFALANPTIALNGSGSADAPYLVLYLDTTGVSDVSFSFNARDLDGSADDAVQPIAVQWRIGDTGTWQNVEGGYIADATAPGTATLVTPVSVTLPPEAEGQAALQLRVITANAAGNDEWVGIDDIVVSAGGEAEPPAGVTVSIAALDADKPEGEAGATTAFTFTVTRSSGEGAGSVAYRVVAGTADADDFGATLPTGTVAFAEGETSATVTIEVAGDAATEADETFAVTLSDPSEGLTLGAAASAEGVIRNDDINVEKISAVQGSGAASGMVGRTVTVEAIVVGDFQNGDADTTRSMGGFYLQEELGDQDGDAATSEGLYIFQGALAGDVALGDKVRVTGVISEYFGQTQLTASAIEVVEAGAAADVNTMAVEIDLPAAGVTTSQDGGYQADLEAYEGMLVRVKQTMTLTEQFNLDRFNEVVLTAGERAEQFTQGNAPDVAGYDAHLRELAARSITYDDGLNTQNNPVGQLDGFQGYGTGDAPRMGDTVDGLTGVLDYQWAGNSSSQATWRLRAVEDGANEFVSANPREDAPAELGGRLTVGSLNVLNLFATLDENGALIANGQEPRGANSAEEYDRQLGKLVNTLLAMDADVLGLMELENDFLPGSPGNALEKLVAALNAAGGEGEWAWVDPGQQHIGGDAIAVGFIYRADKVRIAEGSSVALLDDSQVDPALLAQSSTGGIFDGENASRPAMAVTFEELATGEAFTASVNHFKSKGGSGEGLDADQLNGAGSWNHQRELAAQALDAWLAGNPTGSEDGDVLILGDLNSYAKEAPIQYLIDQGFEDLQATRIDGAYSYVFDGQTGSLDQILANASLAAQVTGATEWHINADEADALDYNLDFGRDPSYFDADAAVRVSDHDPLLVGLNLGGTNAAPTLDLGAIAPAAGTWLTVLDASVIGASDDRTAYANLVFTLDAAPAGELWLKGRALEAGETFTGADVEAGDLAYLAPASRRAADGFDLTVSDGVNSAEDSVAVTLPGFAHVQDLAQWGGYWGTPGSDMLYGTAAGESMAGGAGHDLLMGRGGDDFLYAGSGNDRVLGGAGADFITGDDGDDWLEGGAGRDTLFGGNGNDVLWGGAGNGDVMSGGAGDDLYIVRQGDGRDFVEGMNAWENDRIDLRDFADVLGGIDSWAKLQAAEGMVESPQFGGDTVLNLTAGDVLTIRWMNASQLNEGDFLFA